MQKRYLQWLGLAVIVIASSCMLWASYQFYHFLHQPLFIKTTESAIVTIPAHESAASFTNRLAQGHYITSKYLLRFYIRIEGLSTKLKAGIYEIKQGETAPQFINRVINGDVLRQNLCIPEGVSYAKVSEFLRNAPYLNYHDEDWHVIQAKYTNPEGLLLADTYQYHAGASAQSLLLQANRSLWQFLDEVWKTRANDLPYKSAYDLLIAASIIEKEAANPAERRLIAGVLINRINKRMPLQMDPTVIYGLGDKYQGKLTHQDLKFASPYNTYLNYGLPPTPIAMVGRDSILAAAHPTLTSYLYYVAKGDGGHEFSVNYVQQRQAIKRYQHKKAKP